MRFWAKLILLLLVVALLAFLGWRLFGMFFQVIDGIRNVGVVDSTEDDIVEQTNTPPPVEWTDQDYDAVQGVREY